MTLTVAFLAVTCAVAIGVAVAVPSGFARSPSVRQVPKMPVAETRGKIITSAKAFRASESCCGDLGCFSSGGAFFSLLLRPINSVPNCDLTAKLKLHLNTRANPIKTQILDPYHPKTIDDSNFKKDQKTIVIIHGFLDNFQWPWWKETVKEMLQDGNYNVVRMDWSHGNTLPYLQAAANIRLVGSYVARFLMVLKDLYGMDPMDMHIVGHSLGAHGAGYAGATMKQYNATIGRITGLDPAGPYFHNMPAEVSLDQGDARFVDTIVTDGEPIINWAFGSSQPMGHVNFFPNGGLNQPGCESGILNTIFTGPTMNSTSFDLLGTVAATAFEAGACNHARAPVLFHESINNKACTMKSFQCDNYDKFLSGECFRCAGGRCAALGWHVDPAIAEQGVTKNFYTITTEKSPFCTSPHMISFTLQPKTAQNGGKTKTGYIYVTLIGTLATSEKRLLTPDAIDLIPGATYTFFFETRKELGLVQSVIFYWDNKANLINPISWIRDHYIYLDGDIVLTEPHELVSHFQPTRVEVEQKKDLHAPLVHSYMNY